MNYIHKLKSYNVQQQLLVYYFERNFLKLSISHPLATSDVVNVLELQTKINTFISPLLYGEYFIANKNESLLKVKEFINELKADYESHNILNLLNFTDPVLDDLSLGDYLAYTKSVAKRFERQKEVIDTFIPEYIGVYNIEGLDLSTETIPLIRRFGLNSLIFPIVLFNSNFASNLEKNLHFLKEKLSIEYSDFSKLNLTILVDDKLYSGDKNNLLEDYDVIKDNNNYILKCNSDLFNYDNFSKIPDEYFKPFENI